jgi:DNA repair protein SbcD/Mre11
VPVHFDASRGLRGGGPKGNRFRFIHAARLLLDRPLRGTLLHDGSALPDAIRPIVQEATFLAFDRIVEACLAHQVDLLLLAGDCFDRHDHSLRAPTSLVRGFERLAESEIVVVIAPGAGDPWEIWPAWLHFPANVIRLGSGGETTATITRDGRPLAVVRAGCAEGANAAEWKPPEPDNEEVVKIVVSPGAAPSIPVGTMGQNGSHRQLVYHACGGGAAPQTSGSDVQVAHDPGPSQGTHPLETGARGCTLVTVTPNAAWQPTFVPAAPVRYEQIRVNVTPELKADDLLFEMLAGLESIPRHASDRVWLVTWHVFGQGPLMESLAPGPEREALLETVHASHGLEGVEVATSAIRIYPEPAAASEMEPRGELAREFDRRLAERLARAPAALRRCLTESPLGGGPWEIQLESLVAELDAGEIAHDARRLGLTWFAAEEELSS